MARKELFGLRLDPEALATVRRLAKRTGIRECEFMRRLVPNEAWAEVLAVQMRTGTSSPLYALATEGLKRVIRRSRRPISDEFLETVDPSAMPDLYLKWLDACAAEVGNLGPHGGPHGGKCRWIDPDGAHGFVPDLPED